MFSESPDGGNQAFDGWSGSQVGSIGPMESLKLCSMKPGGPNAMAKRDK